MIHHPISVAAKDARIKKQEAEIEALRAKLRKAEAWLEADERCRADDVVYNTPEEWDLTGDWMNAREAFREALEAAKETP